MEVQSQSLNISTDTRNVSENGSLQYLSQSTTMTPELILYRYVLPIIIFVGLLGNIVSIIIFLGKELRHISSSVYILAVLCSDTGMLLNQILPWLEVFSLTPIHVQGVCQIFVFIGYVFGFLSEWYIVCITVENYITLRHPTKINTMCTVRRALIVTLSLTFLATFFYSANLFTLTVTNGVCRMKYSQLELAYYYIDNIVTLLLPTIFLLVLLAAIVLQVIKSLKTKRRMSMTKKVKRQSSIPQIRVATMLFVLSLSSFVLSTPDHIFRLYFFLLGNKLIPAELSVTSLVLLFLYYTRFSTKFFILVAFSTNFRKKLLSKLNCARKYYDAVDTKAHGVATQIPP